MLIFNYFWIILLWISWNSPNFFSNFITNEITNCFCCFFDFLILYCYINLKSSIVFLLDICVGIYMYIYIYIYIYVYIYMYILYLSLGISLGISLSCSFVTISKLICYKVFTNPVILLEILLPIKSPVFSAVF